MKRRRMAKKRRISLRFTDAAYFNWALDTDQTLRKNMDKLTLRFSQITEREYVAQMLGLFRRAGLVLTEEELNILLMLRHETDRMLLEKEIARAEERGGS